MARLSAKLRSVGEVGGIGYWCQGCDGCHVIMTGEGPGPRWGWDGNVDAPTFTPSVRVTGGGSDKSCCHTFVNAGMVQFLSDCTHKFAGQTLPLPDWPYAEGEYGGV